MNDDALPSPTSEGPRVIVCLGAGGVGKTSCSAALALAYAHAGKRTLAVTLDPARRLEDALGEAVESSRGRLRIHQPKADTEFASLVDDLFSDRPDDRELLDNNRIFQALSGALAGMHEMAAVARLPTIVADHQPEVVVVDTAPTRHALKSMRLASRVVDLVDSKALAIIARLLGSTRSGTAGAFRRTVGRLARRPVARILEATVGERPVVEMVELLELLLAVRPQLAELAAGAERLLRGDRTRYVVVTSASESATATAAYLASEAKTMGRPPTAFLINRAVERVPDWIADLAQRRDVPDPFRAAVNELFAEDARAVEGTANALWRLSWAHEGVPRLPLPRLDAAEPGRVVDVLSLHLARELVPRLKAA